MLPWRRVQVQRMAVDAAETQKQARFLDTIIVKFVHTEETLQFLSSVISPTIFFREI